MQEFAITLPLTTPLEGYAAEHLEVRMNSRQATIMRRLFEGLRDSHAQLADGRHVDTPPRAIQFVLEQLANAVVDMDEAFYRLVEELQIAEEQRRLEEQRLAEQQRLAAEQAQASGTGHLPRDDTAATDMADDQPEVTVPSMERAVFQNTATVRVPGGAVRYPFRRPSSNSETLHPDSSVERFSEQTHVASPPKTEYPGSAKTRDDASGGAFR